MADKKQPGPDGQKKAEQAAKAFISQKMKKQDPGGSYTGRPADWQGKPDQDADDL